MYIYGASGHAKVIIESLESSGESIEGIFDDNIDIKGLLGHQVVAGKYVSDLDSSSQLIIAVGSNTIRARLVSRMKVQFGNVIHSNAILSKSCQLGLGVAVMAGVVVNANVKIGNHTILNTNCSVDHDCVLEDFVHIGSNSALCGNVHVGEMTLIGAASVVLPNIKIGKNCTIGAGAIVTKDVPDDTTVKLKF